MKEILYYVLKYGDMYYAPYQSFEAFEGRALKTALSSNKKLAIRFGKKDIASAMRHDEVKVRAIMQDDFDPALCRVVRVVKKARHVH